MVDRLGRDVHHVFPFQKKVLTALNTGRPYALSCGKRFGFGRALAGVVREVEGAASPGAGAHKLPVVTGGGVE